MFSLFGIIDWILSFFKPKTDTQKMVEVASQNAATQVVVQEEEAANAEEKTILEARTSADAVIMQRDNGPPDAVNTDPHAPINTDPDANFRD